MYLAVGDSVTGGNGATPGHSYFDLYCAYLESAAGGSLVDQCVNESGIGTTQSALDSGTIQKVVNEIQASTDTLVVTVLGAGYRPASAAIQLRLLAHLSRWLEAHGLGAGELGSSEVERFREQHLAGYASLRGLRGLCRCWVIYAGWA